VVALNLMLSLLLALEAINLDRDVVRILLPSAADHLSAGMNRLNAAVFQQL
jgi:hypothetical protein